MTQVQDPCSERCFNNKRLFPFGRKVAERNISVHLCLGWAPWEAALQGWQSLRLLGQGQRLGRAQAPQQQAPRPALQRPLRLRPPRRPASARSLPPPSLAASPPAAPEQILSYLKLASTLLFHLLGHMLLQLYCRSRPNRRKANGTRTLIARRQPANEFLALYHLLPCPNSQPC